ncbi:MAG TPA: helix-turn-helix domain-containing protein [Pseudonocardiaceae bacterium]|nr:helix-turn-helix domain-containing protein [Pseudonocardiaceae bacterium]
MSQHREQRHHRGHLQGSDGHREGQRADGARTGRPPKISRADIVTAASRIIEEQGIEALTMRALARDVGTTAMALYHHVADKNELLRLLLDEHAAVAVKLPDQHFDDPLEQIVAVASAMRAALASRPWVVEVIRADDLMSTRALPYTERIVDGFQRAGLSPEDAVDAYRIIWHYTAGEISGRAAAARRQAEDRPTYRSKVFADLDPAELPRLAELSDRWLDLSARDTFDKGIRALVKGLLLG